MAAEMNKYSGQLHSPEAFTATGEAPAILLVAVEVTRLKLTRTSETFAQSESRHLDYYGGTSRLPVVCSPQSGVAPPARPATLAPVTKPKRTERRLVAP